MDNHVERHIQCRRAAQETHWFGRFSWDMTKNTNRSNSLRRTVAGLAAATTIAFGGIGTLSAADAQAAGVKASSTYVVQSSSSTVTTETAANPRRGRV